METAVQRNPFADGAGGLRSTPAAVPPPAATAIEQQRAIAEVQAAMVIARANPRDPVRAMDRILNACTRLSLAEQAIYQYARGGSDISGPSIRLAEAVAQIWGNIQFGIRELEQRPGMSIVQAYAWDVETNTRREMTFAVPHIRRTKQGSYGLEDPRDIYEMVANQGARRLRACILGVIPGDVIEAAVAQCEATLRAKADTSPEAIQRLLGAFAEFGVTREQIERLIQRRLDDIQPAQVVRLRKIYTSLRDGMSKPADWFEEIAPARPSEPQDAHSPREALKARLRARKEQGQSQPKAQSQPDEAGAPGSIGQQAELIKPEQEEQS